jgi:CheY-like chemotaxis protein
LGKDAYEKIIIGIMEPNLNIEYDWTGKTILIAEDELINFRLLQLMLAKCNVNILHGRDGLQTLEIFRANPQINLILMDIKMPEMDGSEVTREIRKTHPNIPIIAQTAYALDDEKQKSLDAGCTAYITKPINKNALLKLINSLLYE